jgi:hypothetical protein
MSTTVSEFAQNAQEQTLKSLQQTQKTVVEAVRTWATAVEKTLPETPALPFAEHFPSPAEIVKTSFDFAEKLLKLQREFAESLVAAAAPVSEPKSPPKKTTNSAS